MAIWPFRPAQSEIEAEQLLACVVQAGRNPAFFGAGRAADSLEGRFEVITLHAALALLRLRALDAPRGLAQRFTDLLFRHFDAGLREAGVGDLAVPKRMHRLAGAFYGRLARYAAALEADDAAALESAIARNALGDAEQNFAAPLAAHLRAVARAQAAAPAADLIGAAGWPSPPDGFGI